MDRNFGVHHFVIVDHYKVDGCGHSVQPFNRQVISAYFYEFFFMNFEQKILISHILSFRTVASSFIAADEDQCNDFLEPIFGKKHSCDPETTFCFQSISNGSSSTRGAYTCICNFGYYVPNQTLQGFEGHVIEAGNGNFSCLRCPGGCPSCDKDGVCNIEETYEAGSMEILLKASIGAVLGACILCCMVLAAIVFRQRKCKTIASGMWTVLEIILLGVILSYGAVNIHLNIFTFHV